MSKVPYGESASLYDLVYGKKWDYGELAEHVHMLIEQFRRKHLFTPGRTYGNTMLDVGCGTALYAKHLSQKYQIDGVDLNPSFLEIARTRLPKGSRLYCDNLAHFRNGKRYDVITWLGGGTAYFPDTEQLEHAVQNLGRHLKHGGVMLIHPWHPPIPNRYLGPMADSAYDEAIGVAVARTNFLEPLDNSGSFFNHVQNYCVGEPTEDGGYAARFFTEVRPLKMHEPSAIAAAMVSAGLSDITIAAQGPLSKPPLIGIKTLLESGPPSQRGVLTREF